MPLVPLEKASGRLLARPLITADGRIMLQAGILLSPHDVSVIRDRLALAYVEVRSRLVPDVGVEDPDIDDEVRAEATHAVAQAMTFIAARERAPVPQPLQSAAEAIVDAASPLDGAMVSLNSLRGGDATVVQHSVNVAVYNVLIGLGRGLKHDALVTLAMGGLVHDIGVALLPRGAARTPCQVGRRDDVFTSHAQRGHDLMRRDWPQLTVAIANMAAMHHERLDGTGYPHGLSGEGVPLMARVCAIADMFDHLCGGRSGRPGWTAHRATEFVLRHPEQFDRDLVGQLLRRVAVYPAGSLVMTGRRRVGLVVGQNANAPRAPVVLVLSDAEHRPVDPQVVNLATTHGEVPVAHPLRHLPPDLASGIDVVTARRAIERYLALQGGARSAGR